MVFTFLKNKLQNLFLVHKTLDESFFEELEVVLIQADIGVATTENLIQKLKEKVLAEKISENLAGIAALKSIILEEIFKDDHFQFLSSAPAKNLQVILVLGVNGSGKTTFIAKLAHYLKKKNKKVLLAAGDTFRPAAIEQLKKWADRVGVEVVAHRLGDDPAAVVFDALAAGQSRGTEILIIDTAGRLHTKSHLMEELKKMSRVIQKEIPAGPAETLLVIDATTGQNSLIQAKVFHENLGLSGLVLTKMDGTAKGGIVLAIRNEVKIPVKFISDGEKIENLKEFNPEEFVVELVG